MATSIHVALRSFFYNWGTPPPLLTAMVTGCSLARSGNSSVMQKGRPFCSTNYQKVIAFPFWRYRSYLCLDWALALPVPGVQPLPHVHERGFLGKKLVSKPAKTPLTQYGCHTVPWGRLGEYTNWLGYHAIVKPPGVRIDIPSRVRIDEPSRVRIDMKCGIFWACTKYSGLQSLISQ
jgi:hypothetical protein